MAGGAADDATFRSAAVRKEGGVGYATHCRDCCNRRHRCGRDGADGAAGGAQSDGDSPMASVLAVEIATLREQYEARIKALEEEIRALQSHVGIEPTMDDGHGHGAHGMRRPDVSAVLRGMVTSFSADHSEIAGFQLGHESERPPQGLVAGPQRAEPGGRYRQRAPRRRRARHRRASRRTYGARARRGVFPDLPGLGLPDGLTVAAGRKLWSFGYLNERHAHEDDFADRPLPYRAFMDGAYNDDGIQMSLSLPGDIRTEIGGGLFRGDDRPFGGSSDGLRAYSAYARVGGDMGRGSSWGIGVSLLSGEVGAGGGGHDHGHGGDAHDHDDDHGRRGRSRPRSRPSGRSRPRHGP